MVSKGNHDPAALSKNHMILSNMPASAQDTCTVLDVCSECTWSLSISTCLCADMQPLAQRGELLPQSSPPLVCAAHTLESWGPTAQLNLSVHMLKISACSNQICRGDMSLKPSLGQDPQLFQSRCL